MTWKRLSWSIQWSKPATLLELRCHTPSCQLFRDLGLQDLELWNALNLIDVCWHRKSLSDTNPHKVSYFRSSLSHLQSNYGGFGHLLKYFCDLEDLPVSGSWSSRYNLTRLSEGKGMGHKATKPMSALDWFLVHDSRHFLQEEPDKAGFCTPTHTLRDEFRKNLACVSNVCIRSDRGPADCIRGS